MNIVWKKPDNTVAVSAIIDGDNPELVAIYLQENGNIPPEWDVIGFNLEVPMNVDLIFEDGDVKVDPGSVRANKLENAEQAIQEMLDTKAREHGYDNILTASSYAALPDGTPFQSEGMAFNLWRAQSWAKGYQILGEVDAGIRSEPSISDLIAEMPALALPTP